MRALARIALAAPICCLIISITFAATPWEEYVAFPSPENAKKVSHIKYSNEKTEELYYEYDLELLEIQIVSGDAHEAARLAFRLKPESDGHSAEMFSIMLGRLIRINPKLFVIELNKYKNNDRRLGAILGNFGEAYVDKDLARIYEARARISSLKTVADPELKIIRDKCIAKLKELFPGV